MSAGESKEKSRGVALLRMVEAESLRPLTSRVEVRVKALSKKGAVLHLRSPFIDDCHILMDVRNTTSKLAEVHFLSGGGGGDPDRDHLLGQIQTYERLEDGREYPFQVELSWVRPGDHGQNSRSLGPLIRSLKKRF